MSNMHLQEARRIVKDADEAYKERAFNGKNRHFHFEMDKFKQEMYRGVALFPNLREIDAYEFAQHPCISGSYRPIRTSTASVEYMDGIKYTRYANVLLQEHNIFAGYGVAFVAVPEDPEEWEKSQHYSSQVKHKLRHWEFCLCKHDWHQVDYRRCVTTYACSECDFHYEVDSS